MRHPGSYRGARRAEAKRLYADAKQGSFVDVWRDLMPQDGASEYRSADWKRYTDKQVKKKVAT